MLTEQEIDGFLNRYLEDSSAAGEKRERVQPAKEKNRYVPIRRKRKFQFRKLTTRAKWSLFSLAVAFPVILLGGIHFFGDRKYLVISFLLLLFAMLPFLIIFEGRRPNARELVVIAVLASLAVAGRAAFFMVPQFKPVAAIVIITGVSLGSEAGFLVGAVAALASNFFFGQGPWTPWQMAAFGLIGFLAGFLPAKKKLMCVYGLLSVFLLYGVIMNTASVFMFSGAVTPQALLASCISGVPMDLIHAGSTVIFLWIFTDAMLEKLDRVKKKYGIYC